MQLNAPFPPHPKPLPWGEGGNTVDRFGLEEPSVYADAGERKKQKLGRRCALPPHSIGLN